MEIIDCKKIQVERVVDNNIMIKILLGVIAFLLFIQTIIMIKEHFFNIKKEVS